MGFKRRARARYARSPRSFRKARRGRSKSSSGGTSGLLWRVAGGAAYGAGREYISNALKPVTDKIPAGQYSDEIGMGLVAYFAGKFMPSLRPITDAAITIEAARLGAGLASGVGSGTSGTSAVRVYG